MRVSARLIRRAPQHSSTRAAAQHGLVTRARGCVRGERVLLHGALVLGRRRACCARGARGHDYPAHHAVDGSVSRTRRSTSHAPRTRKSRLQSVRAPRSVPLRLERAQARRARRGSFFSTELPPRAGRARAHAHAPAPPRAAARSRATRAPPRQRAPLQNRARATAPRAGGRLRGRAGGRRQLVGFIHEVRTLDLKKLPSVSETIDWARVLVLLQAERARPRDLVKDTLNVLLEIRSRHRGHAAAGDELCRQARRQNVFG